MNMMVRWCGSEEVDEDPHIFLLLDLGEVIGEGSYGSVYKAEWRGFTVAVKKQLNNRKVSTKTSFLIICLFISTQTIICLSSTFFSLFCKHKKQNFSPEEMNQLLHEICIMNSLEHPNVIQFFGACLRLPNLCMIVELAEFGDLHRFLKSNFQEISWREKLIMSLDVARGMEYLYSQTPPIFHRDLKSPNLLGKWKPKLKTLFYLHLLFFC
jgi:serine/threonine-protein kinase CTR1